MMEEGYRIPSKEEFVQGFEFEVVDWTQPTAWYIPKGNREFDVVPIDAPKVWKPMKVGWMAAPGEIVVTKIGDMTIYSEGPGFAPFDVESWIQQRLVRVKI